MFLWYAQNKEKTQPNHSFVTKEFGCVFLGDYSKIKFRNKKETQTTSCNEKVLNFFRIIDNYEQ